MQRLKEERTGGFGYRFVDPREILWGLLRASGMESEKIHIEGFEPGPLEVFEVATALDGVNVADTVSLGQVRLLPHGPVATTDSTNTVRRRNRRLEGNRCGPGLAYDQNTLYRRGAADGGHTRIPARVDLGKGLPQGRGGC